MAPISYKKQELSETDELDLGRLVGEFIDHRKLILSVTIFYSHCTSMQCSQHRFIKRML